MAAAYLSVSKLEALRRGDHEGEPGVNPDETISPGARRLTGAIPSLSACRSVRAEGTSVALGGAAPASRRARCA